MNIYIHTYAYVCVCIYMHIDIQGATTPIFQEGAKNGLQNPLSERILTFKKSDCRT